MYLSGNNFRLVPETFQIEMDFNSLSLYGSGVAELGISGQSNKLGFLFSGNKIIAPDRRFIGTYNTGEPFDFKCVFDTGSYYYGFNGGVTKRNNTKSNFTINRFFVNTTGLNFSSDIELYSQNIPVALSFDTGFYALNNLTGRITNQSSSKFRIFNSNLTPYDIAPDLSGIITGDCSGLNTFTFSFSDTNTSRFDNGFQFYAQFDTSIGSIGGLFNTNRVSGLTLVVSDLSTNIGDFNIPILFDGSGISGNVFNYSSTPANYLISYGANSTDLNGDQQQKVFTVKLEPVSPVNSGTYISEYATGFHISSGGEYIYPPFLQVTGYYYVSDLNWALNTVLLSSGCSGNIPIIFSGVGNRGRNASGVLITNRTLLSGMYGEGLNYYYLPQSFQIVSGGTGYLVAPTALLQTGVFANCYDVGAKYNSTYLIYKPFSGMGVISPEASYLTGEVLVNTGLVSGGLYTGYTVTGIGFTNPGSGYNSGLFPFCSFIRQTGDNLTANASGFFVLKSTGLYTFNSQWSIQTGLSNLDLISMSGLTGTGYLGLLDTSFSININYSGLDNTQPIVSKLTVTLGSDSAISYISGTKTYDITTGFLKKKDILNLTTFASGQNLSFDLSQDELDNYFGDPEFLNDPFPSIGDLSF